MVGSLKLRSTTAIDNSATQRTACHAANQHIEHISHASAASIQLQATWGADEAAPLSRPGLCVCTRPGLCFSKRPDLRLAARPELCPRCVCAVLQRTLQHATSTRVHCDFALFSAFLRIAQSKWLLLQFLEPPRRLKTRFPWERVSLAPLWEAAAAAVRRSARALPLPPRRAFRAAAPRRASRLASKRRGGR